MNISFYVHTFIPGDLWMYPQVRRYKICIWPPSAFVCFFVILKKNQPYYIFRTALIDWAFLSNQALFSVMFEFDIYM